MAGVKIVLRFTVRSNTMNTKSKKYYVMTVGMLFSVVAGVGLWLLLSGCAMPTATEPLKMPATRILMTTPTTTNSLSTRATLTTVLPVTAAETSAAEVMIAYLDLDQQLWLAHTDGSARRPLVCAGKVLALAWSPDGANLAYVCEQIQDAVRQVIIYEVARQDWYAIDPLMPYLSQIVWSPDGCYLTLDGGTSIVRTLKLITTTTMQIVQELTAVGYAWSPEGRYLAVGKRQPLQKPLSVAPVDAVSLAVWQPDSAHLTLIFTGTAEALYFPKNWLPDGRLLYDRLAWDEENQTGHHSLWTITYMDDVVSEAQPATNVPPAYERDTILARLPLTFQKSSTGSFSWSPDGRRMLLCAGTWPDVGIYLFNWAEAGHVPAYLFPGTSPQWQPAITQTRCTLDM